MKKEIGKLVYNGDTFWTLEVEIDGAYNFFAEEGLLDEIARKNECGCDLDNQIVFYPTREQLKEMANFVIDDDIDGLKKYCQSEEIFYYELVRPSFNPKG